jgi:hypothetical protein
MVMCVPVSSLVGKSQKTVAGGALGKPPCKRLQSNLLLFLRTTLPQAPVHISLIFAVGTLHTSLLAEVISAAELARMRAFLWFISPSTLPTSCDPGYSIVTASTRQLHDARPPFEPPHSFDLQPGSSLELCNMSEASLRRGLEGRCTVAISDTCDDCLAARVS